MTRLALVLAGLACAVVPAKAQDLIGELRVLGAGGWASSVERDAVFGPAVPGRALGGGMASFSFVWRSLSAGPEGFKLFGSDRRVGGAGAVLRIGPRGPAVLRPHFVVGAGWYFWDRLQAYPPSSQAFWGSDISTQFSGSLGAGITVGPPRSHLGFTVEARVHRSLQSMEFERGRSLYTVMSGVRWAW
ncbi:MAG: hypothetical protein ACRENB_09475 [Gemmatimonadales bacterium]